MNCQWKHKLCPNQNYIQTKKMEEKQMEEKQMENNKMIITISREFGSGGREL